MLPSSVASMFGQLYDRMPFWKGLPALGRVSCICYPSTQQVETEGFGVPGAIGPYSRLSTTSKQTVRNLPSAQLLTMSPRCHRDWGASLSGNVCEGLEGLKMSQGLFRFLALFLSCHAVCLFQQSSLDLLGIKYGISQIQ